MTNEEFNVMDMLEDYAAEESMDVSDVFKKHPVSGNVKAEAAMEENEEDRVEKVEEPAKRKNGIDPSLVADMDEFHQPGAVYDKTEIRNGEEALRNLMDDTAVDESKDALSDLKRKQRNLEEFKKRHNIQLFIPEGEFQVKMLLAASDTDHQAAQRKLDEVLTEIEAIYPEMIQHLDQQQPAVGEPQITEDEYKLVPLQQEIGETEDIEMDRITNQDEIDNIETQVIINKRDLPDVAWSDEEAEKVKRARIIELNIVDAADIDFGSITDVDEGIDEILDQYTRKTNDVIGVLPASKYRATFTGLTYPEVLDLSNSEEINNLDGERKKWSMCFSHMKNQSIGPWEEYILYKDPVTGVQKKAHVGDILPDGLTEKDVHFVSKYEDFLRKTSYIDLEFMLWKILCASTMSQEVVSITCKALNNGKECGHTYDWVYCPADLLVKDSISSAVLEEMKETGEANSMEDILRVYKTSPVNSNNYVKLHTSGFIIVYGHISAYDYLEHVYGKLKELDEKNELDPEIVSKILSSMVLTTIKSILLPREDGKYIRVNGVDNFIKVLQTLDEIDWMTIIELNNLMVEPYRFRFAVSNLVCPKCKNRSEVPIENMQTLIFIVARSLNSVRVTLKRT